MKTYNLEIIRKKGLLDFFNVIKIIERQNISYWLDYGTLLGAVRDKSLIPWDGEFDISFWASDMPKLVKILPIFKQEGFEIELYSSKNFHSNLQYSNIKLYNPKNDIGNFMIDIHPYIEENELASRPFGLLPKNKILDKILSLLSFNSYMKPLDLITGSFFKPKIIYSFTSLYKLLMVNHSSTFIEENMTKIPFTFYKGLENNSECFTLLMNKQRYSSKLNHKDSSILKFIRNQLFHLFSFLPYKVLIKLDFLLKILISNINLKPVKKVCIPKKYFQSFKRISFNNVKLKVPELSESYLEELYGDWKTPKADQGADSTSKLFT